MILSPETKFMSHSHCSFSRNYIRNKDAVLHSRYEFKNVLTYFQICLHCILFVNICAWVFVDFMKYTLFLFQNQKAETR